MTDGNIGSIGDEGDNSNTYDCVDNESKVTHTHIHIHENDNINGVDDA